MAGEKKYSWILYCVAGLILIALVSKFGRLFSSGGILAGLVGASDTDVEEKKSREMVESLKISAPTSKTPEQIRQAADLQYDAFLNKGALGGIKNFGTDENLLFSSLAGFKAGDLQGVFKAFGYRQDFLFGIPVFSGNLVAWYNAELSGKDLERMKSMWRDTGVW